jgi:hypothetical protein
MPSEEPVDLNDEAGVFHLPLAFEIRQATNPVKSPLTIFVGLAFTALSSKIFQGIEWLKENYSSEPPVPRGHVRVRWTCVSLFLLT